MNNLFMSSTSCSSEYGVSSARFSPAYGISDVLLVFSVLLSCSVDVSSDDVVFLTSKI